MPRNCLLLVLCLALPVALFATEGNTRAGPAVNRVTAVLQPYVDRQALAGAVTLVADKHGILGVDAVGFADVAARQPMRTDNLFWIASQSKSMTAAALMILVDRGRVKVDDPVAKYLPEFACQRLAAREGGKDVLRQPAHPIKVREILTHTSGLPFASPQENPTLDGLPLREAVRSYAEAPLQFEPGTQYQYSNAGLNTAGRIIEVVSGLSYEEFMQQHLFDPLGMKDTTFWPTAEQSQRIAKSYCPNDGKAGLQETRIAQLKYPLADRGTRHPVPAGGLFSTARDVGRFCQRVLNDGVFDGHRVLSAAAVLQMTSKQTGAAVKQGYGFGWEVGDGWCGHGGACSTHMSINRKGGWITVFLVQHAGFPLDGDQCHAAFETTAERWLDEMRPARSHQGAE